MAPIPAGVYAIFHPHEQLATLKGGSATPGTPVLILPPTGQPGEQEWCVQVHKNETITIINLESGTYLSYEGDPEVNKPVGGYPDAREWVIYPSSEPFYFYVVVPGGPLQGEELAFDVSLVQNSPPQTALRPLNVTNMKQAWRFALHE